MCQFFVVCRRITKKCQYFLVLCTTRYCIFCSAPAHYEKHITKICGTQHKSYVNFRWEIVFNNFLNLLEILEFLGDTEL